jgi:hypothetical protein
MGKTPSVMANSVWYECRNKYRYWIKSGINFVHRLVKIVGEEWTLRSMYWNIVDDFWLVFKLKVEEKFALCTFYQNCLSFIRYGPEITQDSLTTPIHSLCSLSCDSSLRIFFTKTFCRFRPNVFCFTLQYLLSVLSSFSSCIHLFHFSLFLFFLLCSFQECLKTLQAISPLFVNI